MHALVTRDFGISLSTQDTAYGTRSPKSVSDFDHLDFTIYSPLSLVAIGMREVGRTAEHGHDKARLKNGIFYGIEVVIVEARKKAFVHLKAIGIQFTGLLDPVEHGHAVVRRNFLEVAFGKG